MLAVSMTRWGLVAGLAVNYSRGFRAGSLIDLLSAIPPVLVAATVGYAVLGTIAVLVTTRCCWV